MKCPDVHPRISLECPNVHKTRHYISPASIPALSADTGAATDGDGVPTYRIYEDETSTPIVTGSMAKLDDANTTGFYTERVQLTAAATFEKGKSYTIYVEVTVNSVVGTMSHTFQMEAEVDANTVSGTVASVTNVGTVTGNVNGSVGSVSGHTNQSGDSYAIVNSGTHGNPKHP